MVGRFQVKWLGLLLDPRIRTRKLPSAVWCATPRFLVNRGRDPLYWPSQGRWRLWSLRRVLAGARGGGAKPGRSTALTLDAEEVLSLDGSIGMTTLLKAIMRALLTATRPE
jgi:hypothetical protein